MKTIYLSQEEFEQFVNKKFHTVKSTGAKARKDFSLMIDEGWKSGEPVFLSNVEKMIVPDSNLLPQLKTLYGIPAGLLEYEQPEKKSKAGAKKKPKHFELTPDDLTFNAFRRGMLYAHAWAIKGLDMESVKLGMRYLMRKEVLTLLKSWTTEYITAGKYPELKPPKVSIDHTLYDFQFIALGTFLRKYFYADMNVMPENQRDWLLKKLNVADLENPPAPFEGLEGILAGYLIALKASNADQRELSFILEKASKFINKNRDVYYGMIMSALFFVGVSESKANTYFMAASAKQLFREIESFCFSLVYGSEEVTDFNRAYDIVTDAILNPLPNAVDYYKLKNPAIRDFSTYVFNEKEDLPTAQQQVVILEPNQSLTFLKKSGRLINMGVEKNESLTITADPYCYKMLQSNGSSAILIHKDGTMEGDFKITKNTDIVADGEVLYRWLKQKFPIIKTRLKLMKKHADRNWLILCGDYQITHDELYYMQRFYSAPESVTIFNFCNRNQKNQGSNAQLQKFVENCIPDTPIRIITKFQQELPWEMVLLGIGALRNHGFSESAIFDLRKNKTDVAAYEIALRCFRDLIVFDKDQKYMFMNLS